MFLLIRVTNLAQGERKNKFYLSFPSRRLNSSLRSRLNLVQGERKSKFYLQISEPQPNFASVSYGGKSNN